MDFLPRLLILLSILYSVCGQAPVVLVEPNIATLRQGESASFKCRVQSGAKPVQLQWRRADNQALQGNYHGNPADSMLTITQVTPANQGQYRCVATNSAGKNSATAVLYVKYAPKMQVTPRGPLRVRVGKPVSVQCRATGRPRPQITWKRQGSPQQLNTSTETSGVNTLQWSRVQQKDSGVYICQAENTEGVTEVKVRIIVEGERGTPVASVGATDMTVVEKQNVTLKCNATGSPTPVITWSKLRAPLPWKHTVVDGVLTLTSVGRQDSGQYICNATNRHGYSEAYTQMEVESPPEATCLPDRLRLRPGDSMRVQCIANGSPHIRFDWSRVGRAALRPGAQTNSDGRLFIASVKLSDSGTYRCVATNHIGHHEALVEVLVKA